MLATRPRVLSFAEGLKLLGVSRSTAYDRMSDPESDFLRPFRNGGRLCYLDTDIYAWLDQKARAAQNKHTEASAHPENANLVAAGLADLLAQTLRRAS